MGGLGKYGVGVKSTEKRRRKLEDSHVRGCRRVSRAVVMWSEMRWEKRKGIRQKGEDQ